MGIFNATPLPPVYLDVRFWGGVLCSTRIFKGKRHATKTAQSIVSKMLAILKKMRKLINLLFNIFSMIWIAPFFFYPITNFKFSTILQKLFNKRNTQIEGGIDGWIDYNVDRLQNRLRDRSKIDRFFSLINSLSRLRL